jgi:hypothetical protein
LFLGQYEEKKQYYIYDFNSFIADVGGRVVRIMLIKQQKNYTSSLNYVIGGSQCTYDDFLFLLVLIILYNKKAQS